MADLIPHVPDLTMGDCVYCALQLAPGHSGKIGAVTAVTPDLGGTRVHVSFICHLSPDGRHHAEPI